MSPVTPRAAGQGVRGLVEVVDRLRSPGGCPWDGEQTHTSLAGFALEEAYELAEAIESGDRAGLREELGDVLAQVAFHARIAQEDPADPFGLDEVADDVTAKLVGRHPHVFGTAAPAASLEGMHVAWDRAKVHEKQRESVLDGIPLAQGSLARAQKVLARARRAGLAVPVSAQAQAPVSAQARVGAGPGGSAGAEVELGRALLALVSAADSLGIDAETALRGVVRDLETAVRSEERVARTAGPID